MFARVIACIVLTAFCAGAALAQSKSGSASSSPTSPSSPSAGSSRPVEAPVGHRQPRASDIPQMEDREERRLTAEEKAANERLDRALKGICRGC
jgi:hypothetical protein